MEFNEKAKSKDIDYLKLYGQIWEEVWRRRVRWHADSAERSRSSPLRARGKNGHASSGMYISFEVGKNIQLFLSYLT